MRNFDKAVSLIYQAECDHIGHANDLRSHPSVYVAALEAAGLLAPDLPKPEAYRIEEAGVEVLVWESDHISVGVYRNRISIDDPLGSSVSPSEARVLAHSLLAAANYAEKDDKE